jgi:hypothetical protein
MTLPLRNDPTRYDSLEPLTEIEQFCEICTKPILMMAYKGTGFCGDLCRKKSGKRIEGEVEQEARLKARNP